MAASVLAMLAVPPSAKAADAAVDLFKSKCAMCDGPDGAGETVMGKEAEDPRPSIRRRTEKIGHRSQDNHHQRQDKMPAYGKSMKPYEIKTIVAYILNLVK